MVWGINLTIKLGRISSGYIVCMKKWIFNMWYGTMIWLSGSFLEYLPPKHKSESHITTAPLGFFFLFVLFLQNAEYLDKKCHSEWEHCLWVRTLSSFCFFFSSIRVKDFLFISGADWITFSSNKQRGGWRDGSRGARENWVKCCGFNGRWCKRDRPPFCCSDAALSLTQCVYQQPTF